MNLTYLIIFDILIDIKKRSFDFMDNLFKDLFEDVFLIMGKQNVVRRNIGLTWHIAHFLINCPTTPVPHLIRIFFSSQF